MPGNKNEGTLFAFLFLVVFVGALVALRAGYKLDFLSPLQREMLMIYEQRSLYVASDSDVDVVRACMEQEPRTSASEHEDILLQHLAQICFLKDVYAYYQSPQEYKGLKKEPKPTEHSGVRTELFKGTVGYLGISLFHDLGLEKREIVPRLRELKRLGALSLVVDVRNNLGGFVRVALDILDLFAEAPGRILLIYQDRTNKENIYVTSGRGEFAAWNPIVVLINEGTASTAEILAGGVKVFGGIVMSEDSRSYGKNLIQITVPMSNKGEFTLTVGKYLLPDRSSVAGRGISPDLIVPDPLSRAIDYLRHVQEKKSSNMTKIH